LCGELKGKTMTDRFHSITVVLEKDTRADDAEHLIKAVTQFRGVISASGNVADTNSYVAEQRFRQSLGRQIFDIIYPERVG
jgi:hypothetical protein